MNLNKISDSFELLEVLKEEFFFKSNYSEKKNNYENIYLYDNDIIIFDKLDGGRIHYRIEMYIKIKLENQLELINTIGYKEAYLDFKDKEEFRIILKRLIEYKHLNDKV